MDQGMSSNRQRKEERPDPEELLRRYNLRDSDLSTGPSNEGMDQLLLSRTVGYPDEVGCVSIWQLQQEQGRPMRCSTRAIAERAGELMSWSVM